MLRVWMDLAFTSARLCQEAQVVVALRVMRLARGGVAAQREAERMAVEKGVALAESMMTLATGGTMHKVVRRYRSKVRGNKRRLSRL